MNNKRLNYLMYVVTAIVVIYYALNFTGILVLSNYPNTANEPNIPVNSKILTTNLMKPKIGDFVCYKFEDHFLGKHIRIHRVVGFENDTIELRNGILFVNNINFDENLNLVHYYKFSKINLEEIYSVTPDYAFTSLQEIDSTDSKILIEDFKIESFNFKITKVLEKKESINQEIQSIFNKPWNKDNFGPIIIPSGKVFILGDNRDYTIDSRSVGFINENDIVGVLFKIF